MKNFCVLLLLVLMVIPAQGQFDEKQVTVVSAVFEPDQIEKGGTADLVVTLLMAPGWHIYSIAPHEGQDPTVFRLKTKGATPGAVKEPKPHRVMQSWGGTNYWHEGKAVFRMPVSFDRSLSGKVSVRGEVGYVTCNADACLPPATEKFKATITLGAGAAGEGTTGATGASAAATRLLMNQVRELLDLQQKSLERIDDLEDSLEELKPKPPARIPDPPEWELGDVKLELLDRKIRASERARGVIRFTTADKVKLEAPSEIFIDESAGIKGVQEIEVLAARSDKSGTKHEIEFEIVATDLAKRGTYDLNLAFVVPMGRDGVNFEKEYAGLKVPLEFGLPSMWTWVLKAVFAALLALMTPCVFPMIPVTMSFFTKQTEKDHKNPLLLPAVYVVGIVVSFVAIGVVFSTVFQDLGPQFLATNGYLQGFFGILFVLFSLSLFGMFELRPPSFLMNKASSVQGKGGIGGTLGMGLLFSLTSFTCTAPLVGAILVDAVESGEKLFPIVGMFSFSLVLATPFFFLALFPKMMKSMPKSGGWLNSVKVTLGFLELAFALKFIGAMDAYFGWGLFTRTVIMWMWVVIFIMNGLYLLGVVRFKDDAPLSKVGGISGTVAVALILLGLHTMKGAQGAQMPALMEALMPPSLEEKSDGGLLGWNNHISDNPEVAIARAKELGVPLFIDFTGFT